MVFILLDLYLVLLVLKVFMSFINTHKNYICFYIIIIILLIAS